MRLNNRFSRTAACLALIVGFTAGQVAAQAALRPSVDRVEPPDWWAGQALNPVRVLLHGRNLKGAHVQSVGIGLTAKVERASATGDYLFVDVTIDKHAVPGSRGLRVVTASGSTTAPFTISPSLPAPGRFQGFTPNDVVYQIMPDRFSDGDPSNDEPANAQGLYGRSNPHLYHGGGFPGDAQNDFTAAGRTPEQQMIWQHVRTLAHLHAELAPLRGGSQKTLFVTDKQWSYARILGHDAVIIALNNDTAPATFTVPVGPTGIGNGVTLSDRLGVSGAVQVTGGAMTITLPARSGAVFVVRPL